MLNKCRSGSGSSFLGECKSGSKTRFKLSQYIFPRGKFFLMFPSNEVTFNNLYKRHMSQICFYILNLLLMMHYVSFRSVFPLKSGRFYTSWIRIDPMRIQIRKTSKTLLINKFHLQIMIKCKNMYKRHSKECRGSVTIYFESGSNN
jgi:cell division protein FtsW (lipid II flippase)